MPYFFLKYDKYKNVKENNITDTYPAFFAAK